MTTHARADGKLRVLLVGVDRYLPNELPDGTYFKNLAGCVRDINNVESYLRDVLGLAGDRIIKLTASDNGGETPAEPPELWPTKQNIVAAFKLLTDVCEAGDQVYIHYSGHGGRVRTPPKFLAAKGGDGYDEVLVPADICNSEDRYLRDLEMAHLLREMVEKGLVVTLVLDSCHSGGATRSQGPSQGADPRGVGVRSIGVVDAVFPETESVVASDAELIATWGALSKSARAVEVGGGWQLEPKGYVLLAACRASEYAREFPFDGKEKNGALTYWLLDTLRESGGRQTFKAVYGRLLAKIHKQFPDQTPQLQGERDRVLFGDEFMRERSAALIEGVSADGSEVELDAGQAHGIRVGARFVIYRRGAADFKNEEGRVAEATVAEVRGASSHAKITERYSPSPVEQGDQAVLLDSGDVRLRRSVRVSRPQAGALDAHVSDSLDELEELLANEKKFLNLSLEETETDFRVTLNKSGEYVICGGEGEVLPNVRPPIRADDYAAAARLFDRLTHLAKFKNVLELENWDAQSPLAGGLTFKVKGVQSDYVPGDKPRLMRHDGGNGSPQLKAGEWLFVGIKNSHTQVLNVTLLDLESDWSIRQVFPQGAALFEPLDPGQEILLPLRVSLPDGCPEGRDILKVFATISPANFRWLELGSLGQPQGAERSKFEQPSNPLQKLLAAVASEGGGLRAVELAAHASREWTAAQLTVNVRRE